MLQIAWKFIKYDKSKSIGVVVGIFISTFLIGQQLGVLFFLSGLMGALATDLKAQIWVVDDRTTDVNQVGRLDVRNFRAIQGVQGVKEAIPLVITAAPCVFDNGTSGVINLLGVEREYLHRLIDANKISVGKIADLRRDGAISAEFYDKKNLGGNIDVGTDLEINGRRAFFAIQTKGFRGFGSSFSITTIERARFYSSRPSNEISAVLVNVLSDSEVDLVLKRINTSVSGIRAWKSADFARASKQKILASSGIALSTGVLIVFALITGFFIIGLTMYSSALDRIKDYGTLKAIGASNTYITKLILVQATILTIVGFLIGVLLLQGFRMGVRSAGLLITISIPVFLLMFFTISIISISGASFALRRIKNIEPAAVFRG